MKRVVTAELLDSDQGTPQEIATSLADIHRINEWFGGVATGVGMMRQVAQMTGRKSFSYLESAAGSGDSARSMCHRLERDGVHLQLTLLDRAGTHLPESSRAVVADALALPFRDSSFDVVGCSLFTHHLSQEEVVRFVEESLRVARTAVLINDLVRGPVPLALAYASLPLHRSRISRHDGIASVRQSYTLEEMRSLLRQTSAASVEVRRRYVYRMAGIAWKND